MSNQPPPSPNWEPPPGGPQGGQPQYGQPQHGQPQHGQPQHGQPQHGQPQHGQPQHGQPAQPGFGQQTGQSGYEQPGYGGFAPGIGQFGSQLPFASFGSRFVAVLIDGLAAGLLGMIAYIPGIVAFVAAPKELSRTTNSNGEVVFVDIPTGAGWGIIAIGGLLSLVLFLALIYFYYIKPIATSGQTLGKKAMGIKVVDGATLTPIGTGRSVARYAVQTFLSGAVCYLGYFWMLWDDKNQTWHDMLATSVVIKA